MTVKKRVRSANGLAERVFTKTVRLNAEESQRVKEMTVTKSFSELVRNKLFKGVRSERHIKQ